MRGIMGLKVVIFEDDKDFADFIKELMEISHFEVINCYSLKKNDWHDADVVLGDFRNKIVPFESLRLQCQQLDIPLIAISGSDTSYTPQVLKPFQMEELQSVILDELMKRNKLNPNSKSQRNTGLMGNIKKFFFP